MIGDKNMGRMTLSTSPLHLTVVDDPTAAPTSPPMSACVDDEGSPDHQVMRFQMMAPTNAEKTTRRPCVPLGVVMMPSPTVAATLVEMSAPTTLSPAAIASAVNGR